MDMPQTSGDGSALADRLLGHLRASLARPHLEFSRPPETITGGFDTSIYRFRLQGAPETLGGLLILRLFRADDDPQRALFEAAIQNQVQAMGYPAPKVHMASDDPTSLGGGFMVMDCVP